jgi:hypothetical protein
MGFADPNSPCQQRGSQTVSEEEIKAKRLTGDRKSLDNPISSLTKSQ